jgi:hypothetical protein
LSTKQKIITQKYLSIISSELKRKQCKSKKLRFSNQFSKARKTHHASLTFMNGKNRSLHLRFFVGRNITKGMERKLQNIFEQAPICK